MVEAGSFQQDSEDEGGGTQERYFNKEFVGKCKFHILIIFLVFEFTSFNEAA